jgi:hypothetical protein
MYGQASRNGETKRRLVLALVLGAGIALPACQNELQDTAANARQACQASYQPVKGNYVKLANCLNGVDSRYTKSGSPDADLIATFDRTRATLAANVDSGTITPADYNDQLDQLQNQLDQETKRRDTERDSSFWGISHGLNENTKPDANPMPVIAPVSPQ